MKGFKALFIVILFATNVYAAQTAVTATVDTNQIRIGEQFHIDLTAVYPKNQSIIFPAIPDTFNHFELVERAKQDTLTVSDPAVVSLRQRFTVTSFDSGYFVIPPFTFLLKDGDKTDSLTTEASLMTVITIQVDTTRDIRDIKPVMDVPFPWLQYIIYFIIGWLIVVLIVYIYTKLRKRKSGETEKPKVPENPPYEVALTELKKTEEKKLWQQGLYKQYHSEIADTLRWYIEKRFEIPALELPSDETLLHFRGKSISEENTESLRYVLSLADMVKFAKAIPIGSENEKSLEYAFRFVNSTRPVTKEDIKENHQ